MDRKKTIIIIFSLIILLTVSVLFVQSRKKDEVVVKTNPVLEIPPPNFPLTNVEAEAVVVKDINSNKILFAKNEKSPMPLASITKIMTVYAADLLLGNTSSIPLTYSALSTYGEYGFATGEIWPTKELEAYTLIVSSNDGAAALAEAAGGIKTTSYDPNEKRGAFITYMNGLAREIGLYNTSFKNPSGLDDEATTEPQAFGSALDVANMFQYILQKNPSVLEPSVEVVDTFLINGKTYRAENTNQIVGTIPSLIASKTGYTDAAGGNLAVVYDSGLNRPIIIVVLGSSKEGRFSDMSKLIENTQKYFEDLEDFQNSVQNSQDVTSDK